MTQYKGYFKGALRWEQWDFLLETLKKQADDQWFVYFVGEAAPSATVPKAVFLRVLEGLDELLKKEKGGDSCGIVYADDFDNPSLIKIFDPNNLGFACGSIGREVFPGWIICRMPPETLTNEEPTQSRLRWWRELTA